MPGDGVGRMGRAEARGAWIGLQRQATARGTWAGLQRGGARRRRGQRSATRSTSAIGAAPYSTLLRASIMSIFARARFDSSATTNAKNNVSAAANTKLTGSMCTAK